MSIRPYFRLRTLIIGSAIAGAFVLGMVFEHLKPWQKKLSGEEKDQNRWLVDRMVLPTILNRCIMSAIAATPNNRPVYDDRPRPTDRDSYIMACMEEKGYKPAYNGHGCNYSVEETYMYDVADCYEAKR
jgi:hypothetical protein